MTSSRNFRVVVRNVDMPEEQERDVVEIAAQVSYVILIGGSKGAPGTRPPVQFLSLSCSFQEKFDHLGGWRPHVENPRSATEVSYDYFHRLSNIYDRLFFSLQKIFYLNLKYNFESLLPGSFFTDLFQIS